MHKGMLLHPTGNFAGNLRWGIPNKEIDKAEVSRSLEKLKELGYWASAFPEGDGITFSHANYSPENSLADFKRSFGWLDVLECESSELESTLAMVLESQMCKCRVLVPVRKLWIEEPFSIGDFHFWPPVELDGFPVDQHPWVEYFVSDPRRLELFDQSLGQWDGDISEESNLLYYPLIECSIDLPQADLVKVGSEINGEAEMRLTRRISEQADRALDLLRIAYCNFSRTEYLPDIAGQLSNGFTVVYVIPELRQYKETLLSHIIKPIRSTNNWLGLEANYIDDPLLHWLAHVMAGTAQNDMEQAVRSSMLAVSQAFYTVYDEARFLALVFALDGLCSPNKNWTGWSHRTYIAAVSSKGNLNDYERYLRKFDYAYVEVRNKLVHGGATFADLDKVDSSRLCDFIHGLIMQCVGVAFDNNFEKVEEMHSFAKRVFVQPQFEIVTRKVIDEFDLKRGRITSLSFIPKWL